MSLECIRGASLAPLNTFGIDECAEQLCLVHSDAELREALALADQRGWPVHLLGGGSNLVLAGPVSGLTVVMRSRGRRVVRRNGDSALIEAEAGCKSRQCPRRTDSGCYGCRMHRSCKYDGTESRGCQ